MMIIDGIGWTDKSVETVMKCVRLWVVEVDVKTVCVILLIESQIFVRQEVTSS